MDWGSVQPYSFQRLQKEGCLPMIFIQMPLHYLHLGEVRSEESDRCLDTMSRKAGQKVGRLEMEKKNRIPSHLFRLGWPTAMGWGVTKYLPWPRSIRWAAVKIPRIIGHQILFLKIMSDDNCLDAASGTSPVKLVGFFYNPMNSVWMRNNCAQGEMSWTWRKPGLGEGRG